MTAAEIFKRERDALRRRLEEAEAERDDLRVSFDRTIDREDKERKRADAAEAREAKLLALLDLLSCGCADRVRAALAGEEKPCPHSSCTPSFCGECEGEP